ncbi:phosphatase PAP2 family protein [Alsobacter metallidurans]|uniref:Phosphatase PAP2 family protein n=1 Tax=Alsobacter metallidurans TaxID=340221 RepID=A0A917IBY0_9HYPH|nr:phosphatase PAP2 family protein [Alsobacter metallidurans]GGH32654.1 phosphatase PAP2 family protein [Alsobacter metallidurans]
MILEQLRDRFRLELGSVLALSIVAAGLFAFVKIADEVVEGDTHGFDQRILLALRTPGDAANPIGPPWLEGVMRDITALGSVTVLSFITIAAILYLVMDGKRHAALFAAVSIGGGTLLSFVLKIGFDRPRPALVAHLVDVHTLSFPSGHAMMSAVAYITLGALLARVSSKRRVKAFVVALGLLLAVAIGCSRVYLGVHWPTDVLGGWAVGCAWAMLCWQLARVLQRRGAVEQPSEEQSTGPATT